MFALKRLVLALLTIGMWVHPTLEWILEPSLECYSFVESRSSYLLYTGKSFVGNVPILDYKVTELTSFDSEFELRTLDPEGVIFFGDIDRQQNYLWGHMIQYQCISQWSCGCTRGLGGSRHSSAESHVAEIGNGVLRISIVDLIPDIQGAIVIKHRVADGVGGKWDIKRENTALLYEQESAQVRVQSDMYVMFVFVSAVLLGNSSAEPDGADWTLSVELALRTVSAGGDLIILVDTQNDYILSLKLNHPSQELMLRLRGTLFWSRSYPQALCSGESQFLQLQMRPGQLVIGMGVTKATIKLTDGDYELLKRVLNQPGSMVYLGGSFHSCLLAKIQGVNVDLDLAEVKHGDVRSHSCPAALDIRNGK
uniref:Uncharacterized protein n=1 Tax=Hucho hucho TaxID=62062 RepID=A0A4W5R1U7_9TELE